MMNALSSRNAHQKRRRAALRLALAAVVLGPGAALSQEILVTDTETPFKLTRTPGGAFVLAESGTGEDDGRVSLLSRWGRRFNLLSGLPSAITFEGSANGPTAVAQAQRTLYIALGAGDTIGSVAPPLEFANPAGPSSPIFSSVLRARFDPVPSSIREGFSLTPADVSNLADGHEVVLENDSGERVSLLLLSDFRDLQPDPVSGTRNSNPFAIALRGSLTTADLVELGFAGVSIASANFHARLHPETPLGQRLEERSDLFVADAALNTINRLDVQTGRWHVVARIPPVPNPLFPGLGGPVADAVPTGIHVRDDGDLLVSLLTGFPFGSGAASVLLLDPDSGAWTPFVTGLTTVTDLLEVDGVLYVLEFSTDFLAGAPGRVMRVATPGSQPTFVAGGLISPAGLTYDPAGNELLVSEAFTGRVMRVPIGE